MPLSLPAPTAANALTWLIAAVATSGVILRPWRIGEAAWALAGAALLILAGLVPLADAARAAARGTDVYLFLAGMMLLAECARREGLFDYLAVLAGYACSRWSTRSASASPSSCRTTRPRWC